ncbi:hypothetical protein IV203_010827 [Nitzschia inconspicua]|uniref:Uncharacterized protein n=1 Tax=Nitzschia inconspicua TaxID=303405 RepID=A0A9K3KWY9_9STRA|nr:hypothetical protein IV203_010827 [Nitzschia inconspicua]
MNIPSPAITTESVTPQDPRKKTTTTVTLPDESSNFVAPLIDFRNANHLDDSEHPKNDGGAVGTCMALADLVSEVFELVNDTAFSGVIEGRPDKDGGSAAFLGFIGADKNKTVRKAKCGIASSSRNRKTKRALPMVSQSGEKRDASPTADRESKVASNFSKKWVSSHPSVSNRVKKYFGESPLARRRREKNTILEAMRRTEKEGLEYLFDPSTSSTDGEESGKSTGTSFHSSLGEETDGRTFDTRDTDTVDADDERTTETMANDDAPRDGIEEDIQHLKDAFPPVVQKFHSLNPMKPTMISKYNKQWPPLQFPSEARGFDAFNEEIKNHSSSPGHPRTEEETFTSYRHESPNNQLVEETRPTTDSVVHTLPSPPKSWTRKNDHAEDNEDHLISTKVVEKEDPISSSSSSKQRKLSLWRPTVLKPLSGSRGISIRHSPDTAPIPLTPERMVQVEENKRRVQRNFQYRVKHQQSMIVRQRLSKRSGDGHGDVNVPIANM